MMERQPWPSSLMSAEPGTRTWSRLVVDWTPPPKLRIGCRETPGEDRSTMKMLTAPLVGASCDVRAAQ